MPQPNTVLTIYPAQRRGRVWSVNAMKLQQRDYIDLIRIFCRQPSPVWWAHIGTAIGRTLAAMPMVARYGHAYAATGNAQAAADECDCSRSACYARLRMAQARIIAEITLLSIK